VQSADLILASAARTVRDREEGQFGLFGASDSTRDSLPLVAADDWPTHERLSEEFSAIGFYLSGHPLDAYDKVLKRIGVTRYADLLADVRRTSVRATLAGTVIRRQERRARSGDSFAFVGLSDPSGMFEVMVFSEALSQSRSVLEAGRSVVIKVVGDWTDEELKLRATSIEDLNTAAADAGEGLKIRLSDPAPLSTIAKRLKPGGKGLVTVIVPVDAHNQDVEIVLPKRVQVTPQLKSEIASIGGVAEVETV
jgi:DNA polymerase-3 subunit alpha